MRFKLAACLCASTLALSTAALAQSTGSQDFDAITVTGSKTAKGVGGIVNPPTAKAKGTIAAELVQRQTPGQTVDDIINLLPGVSFQNNDPFGSAGGTLSIRGFDASRITQTWDGLPLNDTGNYAIYSNQQMDPELIDQVTVSLGSTDVDAPTAAATGSTVNYTTRNPTEDFHVRLQGSAGNYDFFRIFGVVDTGTFTKFGTRAFLSASKATNNNVFNDLGKIDKQQVNAKIYQPIGSNGDFVAIAGHYNKNQNNFFGSVPLRTDLTQSPVNGAARNVGTASTDRFPVTDDERFYHVARCTVPAGVNGRADTASTCGTAYDYRYNPSKTANVRLNSRFTLADGLILTLDGGYQYTLANGGGTGTANEGYRDIQPGAGVNNVTGFYGNQYYFGGVDLNGDGDTRDAVTVSSPSTTNTNRFLALVNLRYDFSAQHSARLGYSLDYGRHRQTGELSTLNPNGFATNQFPSDDPLVDSTGRALQKRDRLSKAILHQVFGEYRGKFLGDRLVLTAGVRAPFFTRDLTNYCFTTAANGNVDCTGQNAAVDAQYAALNPTYSPPQHRTLHYSKPLPEAGLTFDVTSKAQVFASYSRGLQVPGTDNLYNSFYFPRGSAAASPKAETTDNFDAGVRYTSGRIQAQIAPWFTIFHDRLASSFDPIENVTVYRNLGTVHKYGVDGDVAFKVDPKLTLYAFGSYLKSKILDNIQSGAGANCAGLSASDAAYPTAANPGVATNAAFTNCLFTKGKREAGAPTYTFGGRAQGTLGPVTLGVQAKRTGPRYVNDQNLPVLQSYASGGRTLYYQVYGAKAPAYTTVDLDATFSMAWAGLGDRTFAQFNVTNLFDKRYVGGFGGTSSRTTVTNVQIGAPRGISGTLVFGF